MNVNPQKTVSKLQAPTSFSSKLKAPTTIAKLPEQNLSEVSSSQLEKSQTNITGLNASPIKSLASTAIKFQEPPQRFSLQPQPTKLSLKPPSLIKNISQQQQPDPKLIKSTSTNTPAQTKITEPPSTITASVQQPISSTNQDQNKQQKIQPKSISMIGKGLPKPVVQINLDSESPVKLVDATGQKKTQEAIAGIQTRQRASSTLGRFGFRGGSNANSNALIQRPSLEGVTASQVQPQLVQIEDKPLSQVPKIPRESIDDTKIEEKKKVSLEETIKNLEQNLANLPTTFNRTSRLKEFVPLQKLSAVPKAEIQLEPLSVPFNPPASLSTNNGPPPVINLRDRMNAKRDQLKMAKQQSKTEEENPFEMEQVQPLQQEQNIMMEVKEQEEERNLPLTAFLDQSYEPIVFQGSTAPAGDSALNEQYEEEEEDLLKDDLVFERADDLMDNELFLEDLQPNQKQKNDDFYVQTQPKEIKVQMAKGDFDEVEELKQSSDSNILTLSTQPTQAPEIKNRIKDINQVKPKFDQLSAASSGLKPQSQPGDQLSSLSSSSANPLQLLKQVSGGNHPRIGLSACQRQGPALAAKKAFEHKRKRFARELNADALNQHLGSINDGRQQCEHCGRRFNPDCFEKHSAICEKVFIRKRKAFSSLKYRAIDEAHFTQVERAQQKFSYYQDNQKLNTKWKQRSNEFRQAILKAKGLLPLEEEEVKEQDDRVLCKYCQKRFAQATAERHIPLCEAKSKDLKHQTKVLKSFSKTTTSGFVSRKTTSIIKK